MLDKNSCNTLRLNNKYLILIFSFLETGCLLVLDQNENKAKLHQLMLTRNINSLKQQKGLSLKFWCSSVLSIGAQKVYQYCSSFVQSKLGCNKTHYQPIGNLTYKLAYWILKDSWGIQWEASAKSIRSKKVQNTSIYMWKTNINEVCS